MRDNFSVRVDVSTMWRAIEDAAIFDEDSQEDEQLEDSGTE